MTERISPWQAYRLRLKRRRLLWRAIRSRHGLTPVAMRTGRIRRGDILCFATMRNEMARLPFFLAHHRRLGVAQFLIVDNESTDGTADYLAGQADVSLWSTPRSYRAARFGMDWVNWLLLRHGHGHWCLTLDADELLIYPGHETRRLPELTRWLEARGAETMAAMMLDIYPKGPLSGAICAPGQDPREALGWFDATGYGWQRQPRHGNISIRGGVRERVFFADCPEHSPHLHKTPLIRWSRRYAYASSTHLALPRRLNRGFDARLNLPTGLLLHTKFLDVVIGKSREEKHRAEHFTHPGRYHGYYDDIIADPDLWSPDSLPVGDAQDFERLGLMTRGHWPATG
ncbi:MAG: glycosyltransferase family 2 protein [Paracoccaceae bacterium]